MKINFDNKNTIKVLSLISAIILWSFVMSSENPSIETDISNIPIEYIHEEVLSNKGIIILEPIEPTIKIRVLGKRNIINRIDWTKVKAQVDLSDVSINKSTVPIDIELPDGVSLVKMSKENLVLTLDHYIVQRMPITVETIGELPESSLSIADSSLSPGQIQVSGAKSLVQNVEKAVIFPDLSTVTEDIVLNEPIKLLDENQEEVKGLKMSKDVTDFSIILNKEKEVPITYNIIGELGVGLILQSENLAPQKIIIKGPKEVIDGIEEIKAQDVNLGTITQSAEFPLSLSLPEGVTVVSEESPILSLKIVPKEIPVEEESEKSLILEDLTFLNLPENLEIEGTDFTFNVIISGEKEKLEAIIPENISLTVDLSNLEEGEHELPVQVDIGDPELEVKGFSPEKVNIILIERNE